MLKDRIVSPIVYVANVILIACIAYAITIFLIDYLEENYSTKPLIVKDSSKNTNVKIPVMVKTFLPAPIFGTAKIIKVPKVIKRPEENKPVKIVKRATRTNIKLLGIIMLPPPGISAAIIFENGKSKTVSEKEEITRNVSLDKVYSSYIEILNNGVVETIFLKKRRGFEDISLPISNFSPKEVIKKDIFKKTTRTKTIRPSSMPGNLQSRLEKYKRQLSNNPMSLMNLLVGRPVSKNGKMYGVKIYPGSDKELFKALEFKPKDIIVNINGIPLADSHRLGELLGLVKTTNLFEIELIRDGSTMTVSTSLD